jgi:Ca-activated chloride channel homolog
MFRFLYSGWDEEQWQKLEQFRQLMELFNYLLLKTDGEAQAAIDLLRALAARGLLPAGVDLEEFIRSLREKEIVRGGTQAPLSLSGKGLRGLRRSALERVFRDLRAGGRPGSHPTPYGGGAGAEELPEIREYRFGDDLRTIDFKESILNLERRWGGSEAVLEERDLVVRDSEFTASCATVLLLDISHSMVLYGEDRFTPAKQVALALQELITTKFPRDTFEVILFGDEAIPVPAHELAYAAVGPFHTNTKAGLARARRVLERRKNPNKQIFMITDGKPTVIDLPGGGIYRNTWGLDEKIINRTLDEATLCRRKGISITTFMVTDDPELERFVLRLTGLNRGKAYLSSPEGVGRFVLWDFVRNRRGVS